MQLLIHNVCYTYLAQRPARRKAAPAAARRRTARPSLNMVIVLLVIMLPIYPR
ncbi:MAG: hypothetical protein ACRDRH_09420 [Pseudonocardia sp.]